MIAKCRLLWLVDFYQVPTDKTSSLWLTTHALLMLLTTWLYPAADFWRCGRELSYHLRQAVTSGTCMLQVCDAAVSITHTYYSFIYMVQGCRPVFPFSEASWKIIISSYLKTFYSPVWQIKFSTASSLLPYDQKCKNAQYAISMISNEVWVVECADRYGRYRYYTGNTE